MSNRLATATPFLILLALVVPAGLAAKVIGSPTGCIPTCTGALCFANVTAALGVQHSHRTTQTILDDDNLPPVTMGPLGLNSTAEIVSSWITGGVAVGDYDDDGLVDIFVLGGNAGTSKLFRQVTPGSFQDVSVAAGVRITNERASGAVFADYDGDFDLDLFVGGALATSPRLYRNDGGVFTDVFAASFLLFDITYEPNTWGGAFGDYDMDGDLDLFMAHSETPFGPPFVAGMTTQQLWRNNDDGTFSDVSLASAVASFYGTADVDRDQSFTPNFADIDNDGDPDLLIASDITTSLVLQNNNGVFTNITDRNVINGDAPMGASVGDYDNDGRLDWFIAQIGQTWTGNRLYRNTGLAGSAIFKDETTAADVREGNWGWGACFGDFNNDRHLDIFHVNGFYWGDSNPFTQNGRYINTPAAMFISQGDGTFKEKGCRVGLQDKGEGRGVSCFDYDGDGDLDIAISNHRGPFRLWENQLTGAAGFLEASLVGQAPNTEGVGARVKVTSTADGEDGSLIREIRAGSNFQSNDLAMAHFGLGDWQGPFLVTVTWLGGQKTYADGVVPDQILEIEQIDLDLTTSVLVYQVGDTIILQATAKGPAPGDSRDADIEWSLTTLGNVVGTGPTLDVSSFNPPAGTYSMFVSVADAGGAVTFIPFTLTVNP